jgi:hypothetical protein
LGLVLVGLSWFEFWFIFMRGDKIHFYILSQVIPAIQSVKIKIIGIRLIADKGYVSKNNKKNVITQHKVYTDTVL